MAIDQEDQDKLDDIEISKEKEKQEQLQKIKEDADLWEERRNKLKDKSMEIAADPQAWLKGFLMKKAMEAGHYAISKKRRLEVAEAKEKESKINSKNNADKLKTAVELKKLEIEPSEIKFGFEAKEITRITESLRDIELNTRKIISVRDAKNIAAAASPSKPQVVTSASKPQVPQVVTSASKPQVSQVVTSDPANNLQRDKDNSGNSPILTENLSLAETLPALVDAIQYNTESIISAMKKGRKRSLIKMIITHAARLMTLNTLIDAIQYNTTAVVEALEKGNSIRLSQFKAENRISASEEAASASSSTPGKSDAGGVKRKSMISGLKGIKDDIFSSGGGLKGIIGNILSKFGVAGKFLLGLGTTFLLPLITNPVGWAVLAGLAVGGLVFAYWDDIVSFVGKMFDGVKSMFSKVVSKISSMFSAVGDAIKEVISFFNPMNLLPMIAKALLPDDMYGAISGFFGSGDINQEKSPTKPYKMGTNDTVLDDMPKPAIKSRGSWGKKSPSIPSIKPNENSVIRKDEMISGALQKGMDNKISQGSGNWGKKSSDTNIVAPIVNNNSTNIRQEKTHDTDITNMGLNKSAMMLPQQEF